MGAACTALEPSTSEMRDRSAMEESAAKIPKPSWMPQHRYVIEAHEISYFGQASSADSLTAITFAEQDAQRTLRMLLHDLQAREEQELHDFLLRVISDHNDGLPGAKETQVVTHNDFYIAFIKGQILR